MSDTLSIVKAGNHQLLVWRSDSNAKTFEIVDQPDLLGIIGRRVVPGADWCYGEQGGKRPVGTVVSPHEDEAGWVYVLWDNAHQNCYRYGADGCFDINLAPAEEVKPHWWQRWLRLGGHS